MRKGNIYLYLSGLAVVAVAVSAQAASRTGWRGDGSGCYPEASPPLHWSTTSNVVWKTALSGKSYSSPIQVRDKLYVASEPALLTCLSAATGAILWQRSATYRDVLPADEIARMDQLAPTGYALRKELNGLRQQLAAPERALARKPKDATLQRKVAVLRRRVEALTVDIHPYERFLEPDVKASDNLPAPTPTSDGRNIYALFDNGVAACFDQHGKMRWGQIVSQRLHPNGQHASPVMVADRMVVHMDRVIALNKRTGEPVWDVDTASKLGSPVVARLGNRDVVVTAAGDILLGQDGAVLMRRVASLTYSSPIIADSIAYFIGESAYALSLPNDTSLPFDARQLWTTPLGDGRPFSSPIFHDGRVYTCSPRGMLRVLNAGSGALLHSMALPGTRATVRSALALAGKFIFVSDDAGNTTVFHTGPVPKLAAQNSLAPFHSELLFSGNRMFVRAAEQLWCIAEQDPPNK